MSNVKRTTKSGKRQKKINPTQGSNLKIFLFQIAMMSDLVKNYYHLYLRESLLKNSFAYEIEKL